MSGMKQLPRSSPKNVKIQTQIQCKMYVNLLTGKSKFEIRRDKETMERGSQF
jgi:hypothetical protein